MSSHSTAEQLKSAAVAPGALFLDVRNDAEVKESPLTSRPYLHVSCMPDDCSELTARADELLPDKNGTYDTTSYVMTFFRSVRPSGEDALVLLQITIQHDIVFSFLPSLGGGCIGSSSNHPLIRLLLLFFSPLSDAITTLLDVSAGDRILQIRSSCGKSERNFGAVGIYQGTECRWPGGSCE